MVEETYPSKDGEELWLLACSLQLLHQQSYLDRFIFVLLGLGVILEINLFKQLVEKILVEVLSKLVG